MEEYKKSFKPKLKDWKIHFVSFKDFVRMGCGAEIRGMCVVLASTSTNVACNSPSPQFSLVRYLTHPKFSSFFGFSDDNGKGIAYRVWQFEVDRAIQENLHSHKVIADQIHKLLQGETKARIVGFSPGTLVEKILAQFDQFYGDEGAAVGDELLS